MYGRQAAGLSILREIGNDREQCLGQAPSCANMRMSLQYGSGGKPEAPGPSLHRCIHQLMATATKPQSYVTATDGIPIWLQPADHQTTVMRGSSRHGPSHRSSGRL
ncbi:hypothetical protein DPEC_G00132450 [Dallia pectoralis]|uniref:Uncharacterized protein n=1 Tax=Dallia pectoralis TaxID=75939 RepID=A0ACC2GS95_DALPE|nr:hypothetical protein DPEC_G00132450 [Dallia pectoralis]